MKSIPEIAGLPISRTLRYAVLAFSRRIVMCGLCNGHQEHLMDFIDELRALATRIPQQLEHLRTEEGTKHALVMPFINALGFNIFDPTEVTPEFVADVGIKKGEKVDYVILKGGQPIMLFECKGFSADLDKEHPTQLYSGSHEA
jgi:hypothetical protein